MQDKHAAKQNMQDKHAGDGRLVAPTVKNEQQLLLNNVEK
jgi:hypothetical protein